MILVEESNKLLLTAFWACQLGSIIPVPVSVGNKDSHRLKLLHIWNELVNPYIFTRKDYLDKWMLFVKEQELSCTAHLPEERFIDVINHAVVIPGIATMPAPAKPGDLAFIQYSSGSTGTPKGVMLTHKNLLYNISAVAERMEATGDDNMISWIPLTHDLGMIAFHLTASLTGCNQYIMPTSLFIRRPLLWMELAHKYKATISFSPNFGYQYFLNALSKAEQTDWDLSSLRLILNGAEPILAAVCRDFTRTLAAWKLSPHIINASYGLAEASVGVTGYGPHTPLKEYFIPRTALQHYKDLGTLHTTPQNGYVSFVTVGKPIAHCQVRICDDENQELLCNRVGHIQIKGENVTAGYYNKLLNEDLFTADGWLRTGDLGFMDQEGELVITGREKNIIILQGQNYYNQDIEQLLFGIDDIALGKVVACADVGKGNEGESFLVFVLYKKPTASFVEVIRQINTRLSNHLGIVPEHIIPVKEIPKTTSGKVQHRALVEKYRNGDFAAEIAMLSEQYNMRTRLTELWQDVFGKHTIDDKENFFTAGGNSLLAMQLLSQISTRLNKQITLRQLFEHASIDQLEQLLQGISSQVLPPEIVAAAQQPHYPLSHQQLQFWTAEKLSGDGSMHNIFKAYNYNGGLDAGVLQTAVELLLQRHEVLRMRITEIDGEPRQRILSMKEGLPVFFYHDLRLQCKDRKQRKRLYRK
jgi:acyl-CoA synthetase (AMP-forming)/AMP-acid ligase II/aryl carrier-like protein